MSTKKLVDIYECFSRSFESEAQMVQIKLIKPNKQNKIEKIFTEVELELMNVIWDLGECTVKDVQDSLPKDRDLAYTSVATMMKILEQKGALKSEKKDRAHTFEPLVSRAEYERISLEHLKANVFGGDPTSMVMRLLDNSDLSQLEIEKIKSILNERMRS